MAEGNARYSLAAAHSIAELFADVARMATRSQWIHAPGSRVHRPRGEQEGGCCARVFAAGREYVAFRGGSLSAQSSLCERDCCRQAAGVAMVGYEGGSGTLQLWNRDLGLGQHGPRVGAGRGYG